MKRLDKQSLRNAKSADPIDRIQMSKCDREAAKRYMEQAKTFAEVVCRIDSGVQFLAAEIGHACSVLAHRAKNAFGKLAHH